MLRTLRTLFIGLIVGALVAACSSASLAATIIRLGLGSDLLPDMEFDGTTLSTFDDGIGGTLEDQNTNVDYQDFLALQAADIATATASFSLDGLTAAPSANVFDSFLVIQNFSGGSFILRDAANVELLSGSLNASTLTGLLGTPGTGALFTTSFASVNPTGLLAPYIKPNSLTLSMSFTDVDSNGSEGFALQPTSEFRLDSFTGDVTINIAAEPIPEPAAGILLLLGWVAGIWPIRRRV